MEVEVEVEVEVEGDYWDVVSSPGRGGVGGGTYWPR